MIFAILIFISFLFICYMINHRAQDKGEGSMSTKHEYICNVKHNHAPGAFVGHITAKYMDINQRTGESIYLVEYIIESMNRDKVYTKKVSREKYISLKIGEDIQPFTLNKYN